MEMLSYQFMQNAVLAAVLAGLACGIVGTLVVINRLAFLAGGVAHAAYGGIGLAFAFGLPVLACTIGFSLAASLLMGWVIIRGAAQNAAKDESDAAIGVLWAFGMAFGIILIELTPGYAADLMAFLFGSILAVPRPDLLAMLFFDLALLLIIWQFHQGLWAISLDRGFAEARGLPVNALFLLLIALSAVAVVMLIRVVGLILVLALLTIPPQMARRFCSGMAGTMLAASMLAVLFCLAGLFLSYYLDISSGSVIIAVATCAYFLQIPLYAGVKKFSAARR